ncbi:ubiquinone/menaquinone biosynthesis C-methylase UbiE [Conyzicola lurida]|uniref:Ubiquinone/menaquinone biosynthesis C-methylase UbiE n=1 Tax=Conyzicola lurida TaxID=1172621 RepID=A0A841ANP3_9MICO|nr:ubiquinone/menaquinone biosynthesis C-methylase UbiE [Conyzicola lurida]
MTVDPVHAAYTNRAGEYIEAVGKIEHAAVADRDYVLAWAQSVDGPLLDVGCGPGQWTEFLREAGLDVEGVDLVEAFIDDARQRYPSARYRVGRAEALGVPAGSLGGVLAWYSLIHTDPERLDEPLKEFARAIRPGGSLVIGFFDGVAGESFDHAVATAYYWSVGSLAEWLVRAGFTVTDARTRQDPGVRRHGVIAATKA